MPVAGAQTIAIALKFFEQPRYGGVIHRFFAIIRNQILLTNIGNIIAVGVLSEQMIKGLILGRSNVLRNRFVPFFTVRKNGIDVENHAAKFEMPMTHDITNVEARMRNGR